MDFLKKAFKAMTGNENPVKSVEDQSKEEKDLIAFIDNRLQEARNSSSRVAQEGNWMTNYAYLLGYAGVAWNNQYKQFQTVGYSQNYLARNRITCNKILPAVQRRQARIGKSNPRYEVKPDSSAQDDRDQARLEKNVLDHYYEKEKIVGKRNSMLPGLQVCGSYYMEVTWDTEKGEFLEAETKDIGENGEEKIVKDYEYEGDVCVNITSPFEIFPDPLAKTLEECQWYIHAKVRKLDYFKTRYPERGHLVKEENTDITSLQYEMRIQSLVGQGPSQTGIMNTQRNTAVEKVYYEKRSRKHPNGRMVIIANGVLLVDTELPCGVFPHVRFDDVQITDRYYPEAIVTHLRPIQDQYNRTIQKRADWTNKMLAGKYMAPKGSQFQQEAITDSSGEVIYYTPVPNAPPIQQLQVPAIPQYAYEEEDRLNAMFYDISGESDISRGILPSSSIPAIGMELLLEQDETRISAITNQHEEAFALLGKKILLYAEKYIKNERLLKMSDPNMQYVVKKYSGENLKSKHDVVVVKGSLAPTSTAVKRNDILNLYNQGLLGNPADPAVRAKVLQQLEFGDVSSVWTQQSIDLSQVKKTISQIEEGEIPEVHEMDNHTLHIQEKNDYRKSDKFTQLDPTRQAIMLNDIEEHLEWMKKLTAPQFGMTPDAEDEVGMREEAMQNAMQMGGQITPTEAGAEQAAFDSEVQQLE